MTVLIIIYQVVIVGFITIFFHRGYFVSLTIINENIIKWNQKKVLFGDIETDTPILKKIHRYIFSSEPKEVCCHAQEKSSKSLGWKSAFFGLEKSWI